MRFAEHPPSSPYQQNLERNEANYAPLTPLSFLERTADVFPQRIAWIHGTERTSYADFRGRCRRLAAALAGRGVRPGDTVTVMAPNIPAALEAHFGVPAAGAVLNALNVRLEAESIAYILDHSESKVLLTDTEFAPVIADALARCRARPQVIDIVDESFFGEGQAPGERLGETTYEALLAEGDPGFAPLYPADEWQAISLNYTSGTTGRPKGVVYHHRGAYLNAVGDILVWSMGLHPIYLWTLPMFHCNGWCFPWGIALQAGTQVCLRRVEPGAIYAAIADHRVTHLCGAPIVMGMLINATAEQRRDFDHKVEMMTAAAPPPAAVLQKMAELGIRVTHVYGLTEVYGPSTVCAWQQEWDALPPAERARLQARQGVCYPVLEGLEVMDPASMTPVPRDGAVIGEIMMRGHDVMKGYFKNPEATAAAFRGGWFHSGDLAVMHADGYIDIKDRSKDIIISGGENISSIEVEGALYRHPAVLEAAVVAKPDARWGETPCAFVTLRAGAQATEQELIDHCRQVLAHFKAPKSIVFTELPKTSTGKVQKTVLRDRARAL
ncbi:MAG TPA: acyl-CoA synthetase [Geminicoccaceae bacterium]|nr:acyl-CoA synthetase [Geminicoccaceae bacterium]